MSDAAPSPEDEDHTYLSAAEELRASQLSAEDLELIDRTLLSYIVPSSRKIARIVGSTMSALSSREFGLPDRFYARRVVAFIHAGRILSDGDERHMGRCEVWTVAPGRGET